MWRSCAMSMYTTTDSRAGIRFNIAAGVSGLERYQNAPNTISPHAANTVKTNSHARNKLRAWLLVFTVFAACGLMVFGAFWYRSNPLTPAAMLKRMPARESVVVYIDMAQLRHMELTDRFFNNASVGQDPEYQ